MGRVVDRSAGRRGGGTLAYDVLFTDGFLGFPVTSVLAQLSRSLFLIVRMLPSSFAGGGKAGCDVDRWGLLGAVLLSAP